MKTKIDYNSTTFNADELRALNVMVENPRLKRKQQAELLGWSDSRLKNMLAGLAGYEPGIFRKVRNRGFAANSREELIALARDGKLQLP